MEWRCRNAGAKEHSPRRTPMDDRPSPLDPARPDDGVAAPPDAAFSMHGRESLADGEVEGSLDDEIAAWVGWTYFVDTHEHLPEESTRVRWQPGHGIPCDDVGALFSHYVNSDLISAGMTPDEMGRLCGPDVPLADKWAALEPHWHAVRRTGYGQAVRIAAKRLYGVEDVSASTFEAMAEGYRDLVAPGFYERVLREVAGVDSCQVDSLDAVVYRETERPLLLMQDISIMDLHMGPDWRRPAAVTGIDVEDLVDYHGVIDWWFDHYGVYATAVKSQAAYGRRLDFADVPADEVAEPFLRQLSGDPVSNAETKAIQDHLFWYCVRRATEDGLPVKLHTGFYAGSGHMPLHRVGTNPGDVCELLRLSPETTFVLMHICYPYEDQMIAIAKHWHNAVIDMCWAWIMNPEASARFLRSFLMAAPSNKLLTFGGDYVPVELVAGHASLARHGIARALTDLLRSGWLTRSDAIELIDPLMHGNAEAIFRLEDKRAAARTVPWDHLVEG
jgi:predicted TIM-barrel fold metal-dependent hydrolase